MLVVTAIVAGLAAGAKSVVFQAVRDLYEARRGGLGRRRSLDAGEDAPLELEAAEGDEEGGDPGEEEAGDEAGDEADGSGAGGNGGSPGRRPSRHSHGARQCQHNTVRDCENVQFGPGAIQIVDHSTVEVRGRGSRRKRGRRA